MKRNMRKCRCISQQTLTVMVTVLATYTFSQGYEMEFIALLLADLSEESIVVLESHACYGSEGPIINELQCPDQHVIAVQRLNFGAKTNESCPSSLTSETRNTSLTCCQPDVTDNCTMSGESYLFKANLMCSGHRSCSTLRAERIRTMEKCPWSPRDYTNYMTTYYRCISTVRIAEFCKASTILGSSMYLMSENYPSYMTSGSYECQCEIQSSGAIGIYGLDVPQAEGTCQQTVELSQTQISCNDSPKFGYTLLKTGTHKIQLKLRNPNSESPWRFWFYIRGDGDTRMECQEKLPVSSTESVTKSQTMCWLWVLGYMLKIKSR